MKKEKLAMKPSQPKQRSAGARWSSREQSNAGKRNCPCGRSTPELNCLFCIFRSAWFVQGIPRSSRIAMNPATQPGRPGGMDYHFGMGTTGESILIEPSACLPLSPKYPPLTKFKAFPNSRLSRTRHRSLADSICAVSALGDLKFRRHPTQ